MLVHSFATDGYYDFAIGMLVSFKACHGEDIPFLLHTMDYTDDMIKRLKGIYKNLTVKNSETDWQWLIDVSGMKKEALLKGKKKVEKEGTRYGAPAFAHWKHYISIYERYKRSLLEAFDFVGEGNSFLHLDIDLYINRKLDSVFNLINLADVSLLLRPGATPEWRKTYGCILGFTVNKKSRKFLKTYHSVIDTEVFKYIPKGWGQTALWRAYVIHKKSSIKIAQIPRGWIDKGFRKNALIFSANIGRPKKETALRYKVMAQTGQKVSTEQAAKKEKPIRVPTRRKGLVRERVVKKRNIGKTTSLRQMIGKKGKVMR
jgi:hypothetical protein